MVALQPYTVIETLEHGCEIRDYPAHTLISVDVHGDFESVGTVGFGPLVRYISGGNQTGRTLAMTAPVVQEPHDTAHTISFVLPEGETYDSAPLPTNAAVSVVAVPRRQVAALRFSGAWSERRALSQARELLATLDQSDYRQAGDVFYARYDPPWKPGLFRRNEALVEVS
jgi:hypothetical protein